MPGQCRHILQQFIAMFVLLMGRKGVIIPKTRLLLHVRQIYLDQLD